MIRDTMRTVSYLLIGIGAALFILFGLLWPAGLILPTILVIAGFFLRALLGKDEEEPKQFGRY